MNRVTIFPIESMRAQLFSLQQLLVSSLDDSQLPVKAQLNSIDNKGRLCLLAADTHPYININHHAVRLCFGEEHSNDYIEITGITDSAGQAMLTIIPFYCVQTNQKTGIYRLHTLPVISLY